MNQWFNRIQRGPHLIVNYAVTTNAFKNIFEMYAPSTNELDAFFQRPIVYWAMFTKFQSQFEHLFSKTHEV